MGRTSRIDRSKELRIDPAKRFEGGYPYDMRFGNFEIRPLGGGFGCLMMILISVLLSVVGTVLLNLLLR